MPPKKKCFTRIRKNATAMGPAGSVYQGCVQPKKTKEQPKKRRVQPVRKVRQGKDMIVPSPKKKRVQRSSTPVLNYSPTHSVPSLTPNKAPKKKLILKKKTN